MFLRALGLASCPLFVTALVLVSCGTSPEKKRKTRSSVHVSERRARAMDLLIHHRLPMPVPERVPHPDVALDLSHLSFALQNAYAGKTLVPHEDLALARFALRTLSRYQGSWERADFCERIDAALGTIPDESLGARIEGRACSEWRRERTTAPGRVGANVSARSNVPWAVTGLDVSGRQVPVISITHFTPAGGEIWNGFLSAVEDALREAPALVVDLRGNAGGDDAWGLKLAARLAGLPHAPGPVRRTRKVQSPAALAALANAAWHEMQALAREGKTPPPELTLRFKSAMAELKAKGRSRKAVEQVEEWTPVSPSLGEAAFRRPILVLIDRACAAACERTALALERHPDVKWIGEPTAGAIHFGASGLIRLPRSGIEVRIPTAATEFQDKRFLERAGLKPHVEVAPGQDALAVARVELSKLVR